MKKEAALASILALSGLGVAGDVVLQPRYELAFAQEQETAVMDFGSEKLNVSSVYNLSEEEQYAIILYILRQNLLPTLQSFAEDGDTFEDVGFAINGSKVADNTALTTFLNAFGFTPEGIDQSEEYPTTPQEFLKAFQGTQYDIYEKLDIPESDSGQNSRFANFKYFFDKTVGLGSTFIPWSYTSYVDAHKVIKNDLFIRGPLTLSWEESEEESKTLAIKPQNRRVSLNDMVSEQSGITIGGKDYKLGPEGMARYPLNEEATGNIGDLNWESAEDGAYVPVIDNTWMVLSPSSVSEFLHKLYPEIPADAKVVIVDKSDPESASLQAIDRDPNSYTVIITGTGPEKAPLIQGKDFVSNILLNDPEGPVGIRFESVSEAQPDIVRPISGYIDMLLVPAGEDSLVRKLHVDIVTDRTLFSAIKNDPKSEHTISGVRTAVDYMMQHGSYDGKFLVGVYDYLGGNSTGMFHTRHAQGLKLTIPGIPGFSHTFLFSDHSAFSFDNYSAKVEGSTEEPAPYLEWAALEKLKNQLLDEYPSDEAPRAAINAVDKWRFELIPKSGYQAYPFTSTPITDFENIAFNIIKSPQYQYLMVNEAGETLFSSSIKTAAVEREDGDQLKLVGNIPVNDILSNTHVTDPEIVVPYGLKLPEHSYLKGILAEGTDSSDKLLPRDTQTITVAVPSLDSKTDTVNEIKLVTAPIPAWAQIKFVNDETGDALKPTQTIKNKQWGDTLDLSTLSDLTIEGYELAQTPESVRLTGDVLEGAQDFDPGHYVNEFAIHYRVAQTQATVQYLNTETGEELAAPVTKELLVGKPYDLNSLIKTFEGYEMSAAPSTIAGTAGKDAFTIALTYAPKSYKITVVAVDAKSGKPLELKGEQGKLIPQVFEQSCLFNKNYTVQVPAIEDYHADLTDELKAQLSGLMPARDVEIRIPYLHDTKDSGVQTESSTADASVQTETASQAESSTQTDKPSVTDTEVQTDTPNTSDAETQTTVSSAEESTQTDSPEHAAASTQTENTSTNENGTQTEPATSEGETQTEDRETKDWGNQTHPGDVQNTGVQVEPSHQAHPQEKPVDTLTPQGSENPSHTAVPSHVEVGTQTTSEAVHQAVAKPSYQKPASGEKKSPKHARVQEKHPVLPQTGESSLALIAAMTGLISAAGAALAKRFGRE